MYTYRSRRGVASGALAEGAVREAEHIARKLVLLTPTCVSLTNAAFRFLSYDARDIHRDPSVGVSLMPVMLTRGNRQGRLDFSWPRDFLAVRLASSPISFSIIKQVLFHHLNQLISKTAQNSAAPFSRLTETHSCARHSCTKLQPHKLCGLNELHAPKSAYSAT